MAHEYARIQPPVAYLPCRLGDDGSLDEVMMAQLEDGRVALMGYTALDRFFACCGSGHPWVLWRTEELERLREVKHFDLAYLDVPMPAHLRVEEEAEHDPGDAVWLQGRPGSGEAERGDHG